MYDAIREQIRILVRHVGGKPQKEAEEGWTNAAGDAFKRLCGDES